MNLTPVPDPADLDAAPLVVKRPEDLLAFVPLAVGFSPDHSAVMLTFGDRGSLFHARVDLPDDAEDAEELVAVLLPPALRHGVTSVLFVIYDDDTLVADEAAWSLRDAFVAAGIDVIDALRVFEDRWYAVLPGRPREAYDGVTFDITSHPFTARGVLDGRVTRRSREDLRASLDAAPGAVAETAAALQLAEPLPLEQVRGFIQHHLGAGTHPDPHEVARLVAAIAAPAGRDEAWVWLERDQARPGVEWWSDVVRRVPDSHLPAPAAVLGVVAWLAGDGALAWCAVDRCREVDPSHSLARLVAELLESATSPGEWSRLRPDPAA